MHFKTSCFVWIVALWVTGCGRDDNKPDPQNESCLVSEVPDFYFDSGSVTIKYAENNRIATISQSAFNVFAFTYDAEGRISKFSAGISLVENLGAEEHTVSYDASGRIATIKAVDAGQTVTATLSYDSQNRITKVAVVDPTGRRNYTKRMEYDAIGNVTKVYYAENTQEEKLQAEYTYDTKKSPFANQPAFQLIPLISSLVDKSHYLSVNNPVQYKDPGYGYTAAYQYSGELPTEISLLLQRTGNPGVVNREKVFKYVCQ
ncbi:RHS repeat domain-containing protein [Larkinella bovis]|uniref:RHS repeat domain-containing protein n=1 Tax=Larkinella bovis TaxID=683041 RepID=A0ABW0I8X5_9BACT